MGKDPAVLFYTSDFLSGVSFMSMEQRGQYITLLCEQHQCGHIPLDRMMIVCSSYDNPVFKKFQKDADGNFYNERMEEETKKRISFCESRRKASLSRTTKDRTTHHTDDRTIHRTIYHTVHRMGNENKNENRSEDGNGIEIENPKRSARFVPPTFAEVAAYCQERHNALDAQAFVDFYEARGWQFRTGQKMKSWQAAVRTWEKNQRSQAQAQPARRYGRQEPTTEQLKQQMMRFMATEPTETTEADDAEIRVY